MQFSRLTMAALVAATMTYCSNHTTGPVSPNAATRPVIVFGAATTGQKPDLVAVNIDGSGRRQLTTDPGFDACPAFGPHAGMIAFCSDRSGQYEIWLMDRDGAHQRQITFIKGSATFPDVSPDGTQIAFCGSLAGAADETEDIFLVYVDGTGLRRITDTPGSYDCYPTWSPDGKSLAFITNRDGTGQLWVMAADGWGQHALTTDGADKEQLPDWSPDGTKLAYAAEGDVWVVNANGSNANRVTSGPAHEFSPAWTADGGLVYRVLGDGGAAIWMAESDGSNAHVVSAVVGENAFKPTVSWV